MKKHLLLAILAAGILGCSEDETTDPGPDPNAAHGALNMEVYTNDAQTCPLHNIHIDVGNTKVSPPDLVGDGAEGASVSCSVKDTGGGALAATASIAKGSFDFTFFDVVTDGSSAVGGVRIKDPEGSDVYESTPTMPCVFQFAPSTEQKIEPGKVFIQFDCANLQNKNDASQACSSRYGYVYVDRCEK